jgi:hypothetical protein
MDTARDCRFMVNRPWRGEKIAVTLGGYEGIKEG